jgi:hypothetical protein
VHDAGATRASNGDLPSFAAPRDAGCLGADPELGAGPAGIERERGLEARPVEDVTHITFRDAHLGAIRRPEDHASDLAGDPVRAGRIQKLGDSGASDPLTTANGCTDRAVALDEEHIERRVGRRALPRGDEPGGSAPDHEHIAADHRGGRRGFRTIDSAPTGQGAMHLLHPVQVASSTTRPSRRIRMAIGGQRGMHSPHSSQSSASTTAMRAGREERTSEV